MNAHSGISIPAPKDLGDYTAERRTLQILDVLKLMTDEEHSLTCEQLQGLLSLYRKAKYGNGTSIEVSNTFNKSMGEILLEVNPEKHTDYSGIFSFLSSSTLIYINANTINAEN